MVNIKIKPLSVNRCWQGRRFKTKDYDVYERELMYRLPKKVIPAGKLYLYLRIGFSSKASDLDNSIKPILDILQKKYGFDDKRVYRIDATKVDVKKGEEFIEFEIENL